MDPYKKITVAHLNGPTHQRPINGAIKELHMRVYSQAATLVARQPEKSKKKN